MQRGSTGLFALFPLVAALLLGTVASGAKAPSILDGRTRASWRMVRYLVKMTDTMRDQEMLKDRFKDNGCPTDIMWITFGIAKVDAWSRPFQMKCDAGTKFHPHYLSAGADGKFGTADDLSSATPLFTPDQVCPKLCAGHAADCVEQCRKMGTKAQFAAEVCLALSAHKHVQLDTCKAALPDRGAGWADCASFAKAAVKVPGASSKRLKQVQRACEQDIVWPAELLCVIESPALDQAQYCTQTLPRSWIDSAVAK